MLAFTTRGAGPPGVKTTALSPDRPNVPSEVKSALLRMAGSRAFYGGNDLALTQLRGEDGFHRGVGGLGGAGLAVCASRKTSVFHDT